MRTVHRLCTLCEAHCGISVTVDGDRVVSIEGNSDDPLSHGYLCPKGTALADLHHDPDRLRQPLKRVGDGFEECSWKEALDLAASGLRRIRSRHGRDAIGLYFGNPSVHSSSAIYVEVLRRVLRTRNVYSATSVDQLPQYLTSFEMFGQHVLLPIADVDRTDHLLILGANPAVSNGSILTAPDMKRRIKAIRERGGRVVVVDPRRTETARIADEHVAVRPGGDAPLLLAMLHTIFQDGLEDLGAAAAYTDGLERIRELAAEWTPERAEGPAGIDGETIRSMARAFATADSAVAYARIGVCHHPTGSLTHWLVNVLNTVTGNLDRPGGQMFSTPPVDLQVVARFLTGRTHRGRWTSRVQGLPEFHGELPVATMADEILTPGEGQIRGMVLYAGNPALSSPDGGRMDRALGSLEFLVAVDLYVTESTRHADVILPPVSPLERDEFDPIFPFLSVRNQARWNRAVFPRLDGSRDDWEILAGLVERLPDSAPARAAARVFTTVATPASLIAFGLATGPQGILSKGLRRGLTARRVRSSEHGIDLGPLEPRLPGLLRTPGRRVRLAPEVLVAEAGRLDRLMAAPADTNGFDLTLIGRRQLRSNNSWMHNSSRLVKGRDRCTALLHPVEAVGRGLEDGQLVRVTSAIGSIEVPLEVTEDIRPGVVSIPHGWGHDVKDVGWSVAQAHPGASVNRLTDSSLRDHLTGNAALNATRVRVEAG